MTYPQLIAHRGASAYAPENTISAFRKAKLLGATMVELDVMMTRDHVPVVIHDEEVRRTTDGRGRVDSLSLSQIKQLDAGKWFSKKFRSTRIPSLEEALIELQALGLMVNLEIKPNSHQRHRLVTETLSKVMAQWHSPSDGVLMSSFDTEVLAMIRSLSPDQPLAMLVERWHDNLISEASRLHCCSVNVSNKIISQTRLEQLKDSGFNVFVFTVNRRRRAIKLLSMGVDGVFSDYPDLLI